MSLTEASPPPAPAPPTAPPPGPPPAPAAARPEFKPPASVFAPADVADYNRLGLDFRRPMPRPKVRGTVIDAHCHLLAARHAADWFAAGDFYGFDAYVTMTPLEEALVLQRNYPGRLHFITVPAWADNSPQWVDNWLRRLEAFYNLGSRVIKFHMAPGTMAQRKYRLDSAEMRPILREAVDRGMALMSHVGDPDTWYAGKYANAELFGTRDSHYQMWENVLNEYPGHPYLGAHLGGNPENLPRLQSLLDRYPNLWLDSSATRWMVREISARRDDAREFVIRNQDRILFGTDNVSGNDRGFDFLASRIWCHRKLWETAHTGPSPIRDPDVPEDAQPTLRGLALPDEVLQKIYHDNAVRFLASVGAKLGP